PGSPGTGPAAYHPVWPNPAGAASSPDAGMIASGTRLVASTPMAGIRTPSGLAPAAARSVGAATGDWSLTGPHDPSGRVVATPATAVGVDPSPDGAASADAVGPAPANGGSPRSPVPAAARTPTPPATSTRT